MAYVFKSAKELKRFYPIVKGLTARTQSQEGRIMNLEAQQGSTVSRRQKPGIK